MDRRITLHLCLIASVALAVGCAPHRSDQQIQEDIQSKVAADPVAKNSNVTVASNQGKVTLTGKVKDDAADKQLQKIAKEQPGVSEVDDQTSIDTSAAPASQPLAPAPAPVATAQPVAPPPPPPPPPKPITVPAGTVLTVRIDQALGSKTSLTGATFTGTMANPISIGGKVAIPSHSRVTGLVREAKKAGKFKGEASLALTLTSITVHGQHFNIATDDASQQTKGKGKRTAGLTLGGAGAGAAIGGLAGGGKGAAIGALVGVTAGAVGAATTGNNRDISLPAESALTFGLVQSLTLPPPPAGANAEPQALEPEQTPPSQ
jgi:BON domain